MRTTPYCLPSFARCVAHQSQSQNKGGSTGANLSNNVCDLLRNLDQGVPLGLDFLADNREVGPSLLSDLERDVRGAATHQSAHISDT
jgi:hypothetical protein